MPKHPVLRLKFLMEGRPSDAAVFLHFFQGEQMQEFFALFGGKYRNCMQK